MTRIELVRDIYQAYAEQDFARALARLAPEVEMHQSPLLPWGGVHKGIPGFQTFLSTLNQYVQSTVAPERIFDAGEHVVVTGRTIGRARKTGREFAINIVHIWTIRDGMVFRFAAYIDTPEMLRAIAPA